MTTATRPDWMQVGHLLRNNDEIALLPVGTRIGPTDEGWYLRREDSWYQRDETNHGMRFANNYNRILELPPETGQEGTGMTITTMEEFTSLSPGESVILNNGGRRSHWNRVDEGWVRDDLPSGLPVEARYFVAAVEQGLVSRQASPQVGQWFEDGPIMRYVYAIDTANDFPLRVAEFRDGEFYLLNGHREGTDAVTRHAPAPAWAPNVVGMLTALTDKAAEVTRLTEALRVSEQTVAELRAASVVPDNGNLTRYKERLQEALHEYLENEIDTDTGQVLIELMEAHDMQPPPPEMEEISVTIDVEGTTRVEPNADTAARDYVSPRVESDSADAYDVTWTWQVSVTREVETGECGCGEIDRDDVRSLLESNEIEFTDFSFDVNCDND